MGIPYKRFSSLFTPTTQVNIFHSHQILAHALKLAALKHFNTHTQYTITIHDTFRCVPVFVCVLRIFAVNLYIYFITLGVFAIFLNV